MNPAESSTGIDACVEILGLRREELSRLLMPHLDRTFRVRQIYDGIYRRGSRSFQEMTDLSLELRQILDRSFRIGVPEVEEQRRSADGTRKVLFRLVDGAIVEAVDIPERRHRCPASRRWRRGPSGPISPPRCTLRTTSGAAS